MIEKILITALFLPVFLTACASAQTSPTSTPAPLETEKPTAAVTQPSGPETPSTLRVMTHDSFAVSEDVVTAFENEYNVSVRFLESGDTGTALNKAILSKENPLADVFYGVDNTFLSRALNEGIFETYDSPLLTEIPDKFKLDPENQALPVDYGDVCPNYDKSFFANIEASPPENLEDLIDPTYQGLLVVENPATSSPGLAFMLATIGHFGQDSYLDYWSSLVDNDVMVVNDWNSAYYSQFTVHGGSHPIVISYGSSPPAEVIFAEQPTDEAPTAVVTGDDSCFRQIEFVGILQGTENQALAEKWIDFMLSPTFQEDMPLQMFVFPVNQNAKLPQEFIDFAVIPEHTAQVAPDAIQQNREKWIQEWTQTVLR
jgi:thiamine transport system substrate-binding protein